MSHGTVLVTGGTGFVGQPLVRALCARGWPVRILTRNAARAADLVPFGAAVAVGDVRDRQSLDAACRGAWAVVHLAASVPGSGVAHDPAGTNVAGTAEVAAAAVAAGVSRFVLGSSGGVYGNSDRPIPLVEEAPLNAETPYERSKLEAERTVRAAFDHHPPACTILRIAGVYGPGRPATLAFFRDVLRRRCWVHGPARAIVHPTYVDDVVQAIAQTLECERAGGATLNIAGERPLAYDALIAMTARLLGTRAYQVRVPGAAVRAVAGPLAAVSWVAGWPRADRMARLRAPVINRALDTTRAREVLHFAPAPLEESTAATIAWFRAQRMLGG